MSDQVIQHNESVAIINNGSLQYPRKLANGSIEYPIKQPAIDVHQKVVEAFLAMEADSPNVYEE